MNENSLFAVLLRSQWWVSALVAVAIIALVRFLLPQVYAVFAALPFIVIAAYVGWKQLRAPSRATIEKRLERLRAMPWDELAEAMKQAYGRQGCQVERLDGARADFELVQGWKRTLVACKRWKATRTGIEPLRELDAERKKRDAHEAVYVAAGEVTQQAKTFAAERNIRLLQGAELVKLLGDGKNPGSGPRKTEPGRFGV
jgi:restriction system protein